jgi:tetratricopeptide (TPR) repeat protein
MIGDRSGYPLHYFSANHIPNQDFERVAQVLQSHLVQSTALHELPADIDDFVGRSIEIQQILTLANQGVSHSNPKPIVVCITGQMGVGKSALAIHLAHRLRANFLDAQFYVNLHGTEQQPRHSDDITLSLLRAWGVAEASIPNDSHDRAHFFQATFTNQPILLVLDNVEEESQIRSLIPTQTASIVLITSRKALSSLEDAVYLTLTELAETEAIELLYKLVNRDVIHLTMDIAKEIVDLCHRLPLAIHLTAGIIKNQSAKALIHYVEQLRQAHEQIAHLHLAYAKIQPSFALSYQQLEPQTAQLLRGLGLLSDSHFTLAVAAALLDVGLDEAGQLVGRLVDLKLVKRIGGGRYHLFHDSVRLLARRLLAAEETIDTRQAARLRVSQWYLAACEMMNLGLDLQTRSHFLQSLRTFRSQPTAKAEQQLVNGALSWFEAEQLSLIAAMEWVVQAEAWEVVVTFAKRLALFLTIRAHWQEYDRIHRLALEASRQLADRNTEAELLNNLANAWVYQNKLDRAEAVYKQSLTVFRELGAIESAAKTLTNLGALNLQRGRSQTAMMAWKEALNYLPENSSEQQYLKQWMQHTDPALWQLLTEELSDRTVSPSLFQSMGKVIKRFLSNE